MISRRLATANISIVALLGASVLLVGPAASGRSDDNPSPGSVSLQLLTGSPTPLTQANFDRNFTVTARYVGGPGLAAPDAVGDISCSGKGSDGTAYDYPHPSKTSNYTKINAHLTVQCTAAIPEIYTNTSMCYADLSKCGPTAYKTVVAKAYVQNASELACVATLKSFKAFGTVQMTFPPGYSPQVETAYVTSDAKSFKKVGGKCV